MEKIGIDVHKVSTRVCVLTEDGEYTEWRIRTDRDSLTRAFAQRPQAARVEQRRPSAFQGSQGSGRQERAASKRGRESMSQRPRPSASARSNRSGAGGGGRAGGGRAGGRR